MLIGSGFGQNTFAGLDRHCGGMKKKSYRLIFSHFYFRAEHAVENGAFSRKGQAPVTLAEVGEVRALSRTCP